HYTPGVMVTSVPWQLASSQGLGDRDDIFAGALTRMGGPTHAEHLDAAHESDRPGDGDDDLGGAHDASGDPGRGDVPVIAARDGPDDGGHR
ncbi:MAG: hypothetical protein ACXV3A_10680, partial [Kineosporiaceae bacterium]